MINTPHHQMNIHYTPNDPRNPGRPDTRLPDERHNPPGGHLADDRYNHGGHDHINPNGRSPDDRHNFSSRIDGRQVTGHNNARYNKHHVKESPTTRVIKIISAVFLSILFTIGLVALILWLTLRPDRPQFNIHEFSISNLADPMGYSTARITFNVSARNQNFDMGIYYDRMNLTIYYQDQPIAGSPLLFPFYQSPKNTAIIYGTLSGPTLRIDRARWMQLFAARKRGAVPFRVDVASSIRFKVSAWDSRHHKMHANCEIGVGSNGVILASDKEKICPVYFT